MLPLIFLCCVAVTEGLGPSTGLWGDFIYYNNGDILDLKLTCYLEAFESFNETYFIDQNGQTYSKNCKVLQENTTVDECGQTDPRLFSITVSYIANGDSDYDGTWYCFNEKFHPVNVTVPLVALPEVSEDGGTCSIDCHKPYGELQWVSGDTILKKESAVDGCRNDSSLYHLQDFQAPDNEDMQIFCALYIPGSNFTIRSDSYVYRSGQSVPIATYTVPPISLIIILICIYCCWKHEKLCFKKEDKSLPINTPEKANIQEGEISTTVENQSGEKAKLPAQTEPSAGKKENSEEREKQPKQKQPSKGNKNKSKDREKVQDQKVPSTGKEDRSEVKPPPKNAAENANFEMEDKVSRRDRNNLALKAFAVKGIINSTEEENQTAERGKEQEPKKPSMANDYKLAEREKVKKQQHPSTGKVNKSASKYPYQKEAENANLKFEEENSTGERNNFPLKAMVVAAKVASTGEENQSAEMGKVQQANATYTGEEVQLQTPYATGKSNPGFTMDGVKTTQVEDPRHLPVPKNRYA